MADLPLCSKLRLAEQPYNYLSKTFAEVSAEGIALLNALLTYDPKERLSAEDALRHPFFSVGGLRDWIAACQQTSFGVEVCSVCRKQSRKK